MVDPYLPPKNALPAEGRASPPGKGWKVYAVLYGLFAVLSQVLAVVDQFAPRTVAFLLAYLIGVVALVGYAWQVRVGTALMWKILCVAQPAALVLLTLTPLLGFLPLRPGPFQILLILVVKLVMMAILAPQFVAQFRYSKGSLWGES